METLETINGLKEKEASVCDISEIDKCKSNDVPSLLVKSLIDDIENMSNNVQVKNDLFDSNTPILHREECEDYVSSEDLAKRRTDLNVVIEPRFAEMETGVSPEGDIQIENNEPSPPDNNGTRQDQEQENNDGDDEDQSSEHENNPELPRPRRRLPANRPLRRPDRLETINRELSEINFLEFCDMFGVQYRSIIVVSSFEY